MITEENIQKYDPDGIHNAYDKWAKLAYDAYNSELDVVDFKNIDHIVFAGMGGSGTIGDIFSSILSKKNIHTTVAKGYLLPETVDDNTLVVTTSVSGNTAETISILQSANEKNCQTIAFSSGGKMESYCLKNNIEFRKIPQTHSPRASLPNYTYSILGTLNSIFPINKSEVTESIDELKTISEDEAITFVPLAWNFFDEIKQRITAVRSSKNDKFIRYFPKAERNVYIWYVAATLWHHKVELNDAIKIIEAVCITARDDIKERLAKVKHVYKNEDPNKEDINSFLEDKVAKWWLPDDIVFVDELPHTATGKLLKTDLREDYKNHLIDK